MLAFTCEESGVLRVELEQDFLVCDLVLGKFQPSLGLLSVFLAPVES